MRPVPWFLAGGLAAWLVMGYGSTMLGCRPALPVRDVRVDVKILPGQVVEATDSEKGVEP